MQNYRSTISRKRSNMQSPQRSSHHGKKNLVYMSVSQKCKTTSKWFSYNNNLTITNWITTDDFYL